MFLVECEGCPRRAGSSSEGPNNDTVSPPPMDRGVCDRDPVVPIGEKLEAADKGLTVLDSGETVRGETGEALSILVSDNDPMFPILVAAGFLATVPGEIS